MATFHKGNITVNGKTICVAWYDVTGGEMTIGTATSNLPAFGTNVSFFGASAMAAMHVVNGQAVYNGGLNNYADSALSNQDATIMSAIYCRLLVSTTVAYSFGLVNKAKTYADVPQPSPSVGSTMWAIGGISLLLNESMANLNAMIARYRTLYSDEMVDGNWIPDRSGYRARTFIGYTSDYKVFFGVMSKGISGTTITDTTASDNVGYFDMYTILKNNLGCTRALCVDGGGSTKVKYKTTAGATVEAEVGTRNVKCQLALTSSAASNCNWSDQ
jgi:hypothetical protein